MTKSFIHAFVFMSLALFPVASYAQGREAKIDVSIRDAIHGLGAEDNEQRLKVLAEHPVRSAELLTGLLRPTRRGKYRQHPRVVWHIRALRFLTGLDFKARTDGRLTADEKNFLIAEQRRVKFFGTWMSRDIVFVAPRDAQVRIIRQWRAWFARNGKTHTYVGAPPLDDWYF